MFEIANAVIVEIVVTAVDVEVEEEGILGEGGVAIEILIEGMGEALTEGARDILGLHVAAIHENEINFEGFQENQTAMYLVIEGDHDKITGPEHLPHNLGRHLLYGQTQSLAHLLVAVSGPHPEHALPPPAEDLVRRTDEEMLIGAVGVGAEEEVQYANPVEDRLLLVPPAHALPDHPKEELLLPLSAHLLHPDLAEPVATQVLYLDRRLDH